MALPQRPFCSGVVFRFQRHQGRGMHPALRRYAPKTAQADIPFWLLALTRSTRFAKETRCSYTGYKIVVPNEHQRVNLSHSLYKKWSWSSRSESSGTDCSVSLQYVESQAHLILLWQWRRIICFSPSAHTIAQAPTWQPDADLRTTAPALYQWIC